MKIGQSLPLLGLAAMMQAVAGWSAQHSSSRRGRAPGLGVASQTRTALSAITMLDRRRALSSLSLSGLLLLTTTTTTSPASAWAASTDDREIRNDVESGKTDEQIAMEAKLRKKAELQKKATAQPRKFTDSLKGEMAKQKEIAGQSPEDRRAAMCETLGRGC